MNPRQFLLIKQCPCVVDPGISRMLYLARCSLSFLVVSDEAIDIVNIFPCFFSLIIVLGAIYFSSVMMRIMNMRTRLKKRTKIRKSKIKG